MLNIRRNFSSILKPFCLILLILVTFSGAVHADQLAYNSQKVCRKAVKALSKIKVVYLFCGCCDEDQAEKAEVIEVAYRHTGYEDFYEVLLTFKTTNGIVKSMSVDLAYVWVNQNRKIQTVGEMMKLKHDPCLRLEPVSWD